MAGGGARRLPHRQPQDYPELAGLHDLRTRHSGAHRFVQFHVWVPADWTVAHAHERMDAVEEELQDRFPATEIIIHLDPEGHVDRETLLPSDLTESDAMTPLPDLPGRRLCRPAVHRQSGGGYAARPNGCDDDVMQAIAAENNLAETAFLVPSADDARL